MYLRITIWDAVLPFVTFAYKPVIQSTTGFSSFGLVYDRGATCTLDTILPCARVLQTNYFVTQGAQLSEAVRQLTSTRTSQQHTAAKRRYNERHSDPTYFPGQLVIFFPIREIERCEKFITKYQVLYREPRQTSRVNYFVKPAAPSSDRRTHGPQAVHVIRMKRFYG